MRKFLPFSRRQPSLNLYNVNRAGWNSNDKFSVKSMRRISATSLNAKSIQVVRGAYNIDLNKVDSSFTKLHRACLLNDDTQVKKHIHKIDNNSHDSSNRYPIHLATVNGNFAIIKLLIENHADPNVQDNEDNTPLIKSIECGHENLVKYLLNNGADPNLSDLDNNSALHWAMMTESMIAIDALLSSNKCDLSLRNNKDETCLHLAVRSPLINASTFETLIKNGSELNAKDHLGLTALDIAQACDNKIALAALNRFFQDDSTPGPIKNPSNIQDDGHDMQDVNFSKICDDYKQKFIAKNRENLEYEKRLIQLNAQNERIVLDMSYLKEQYDKLTSDYEKVVTENSELKTENAKLLEQIKQDKKVQFEIRPVDRNLTRSDSGTSGCNRDDIDLIECENHEEFLATKTSLQERIKKLQYGLLQPS